MDFKAKMQKLVTAQEEKEEEIAFDILKKMSLDGCSLTFYNLYDAKLVKSVLENQYNIKIYIECKDDETILKFDKPVREIFKPKQIKEILSNHFEKKDFKPQMMNLY